MLNRLHYFFIDRSPGYRSWHSSKQSAIAHWALFLALAVGVSASVDGRIKSFTVSTPLRQTAYVRGVFSSDLTTQASSTASGKKIRGVRRSRKTKIDSRRINGQELRNGDQIDLDLFSDAKLRGTIKKVDYRSPTSFTLSGKINGDKGGTFIWSRENEASSISLQTEDGKIYEVSPLGNTDHEVTEIDTATVPTDGPQITPTKNQLISDNDEVPVGNVSSLPPPISSPSVSTNLTNVDVMVVYTAAARAAAGGTSGVLAKINNAISDANQVYEASGIPAKLNLVKTYETPYVETGTMGTDLSRLQNTSDGVMDEIHTLRDQVGADIVTLWVNKGDYCGSGYIMYDPSPSYSSTAFNVVLNSCATTNHSYVHELGHNMGAQHNRENASLVTSFKYAYGYRFYGTSGQLYRDVMSYSLNGKGIRIGMFSNPEKTYDGKPEGVDVASTTGAAHNTLVLKQTIPLVASYRPHVTNLAVVTPQVATTTSLTSTSTVAVSGTIIDNENKNGISMTSGWSVSTLVVGSNSPYSGYYYHDNNSGKGSKTYTFTFRPTETGDYQVALYWVQKDNRATNVPVDITGADGLKTVTINQQINGGKFNSLGVFHFVAGQNGLITIRTTGTNGYVIADAVQISKVADGTASLTPTIIQNPTPATSTPSPITTPVASTTGSNNTDVLSSTLPIIVDNADKSLVSLVGSWSTGTYAYGGGPYKGYNAHDNNTAKGSKSFTFKPTLPTAGRYQVALYWSRNDNRATNVPVDIIHNGIKNTVTVNQRASGGTFSPLGTYDFASGSGNSVTIRNDGTDGYVIADAVSFTPVAP